MALFPWFKRKPKQPPTLKAIFIAPAGGEPMKTLDQAYAVQDRGLEGDRYYEKTGYWKPVEACQLTLITEHDLNKAKRGTHIPLDNGEHRRNLLISGLRPKDLVDRRFRIGEAVFQYERPRPPCRYINTLTDPGMAKALSYNSGICIKVLESGRIHTGSEIILL